MRWLTLWPSALLRVSIVSLVLYLSLFMSPPIFLVLFFIFCISLPPYPQVRTFSPVVPWNGSSQLQVALLVLLSSSLPHPSSFPVPVFLILSYYGCFPSLFLHALLLFESTVLLWVNQNPAHHKSSQEYKSSFHSDMLMGGGGGGPPPQFPPPLFFFLLPPSLLQLCCQLVSCTTLFIPI